MTDELSVILIQIESKYGRLRAYPANDAATAACRLTGNTTLRRVDLETLKAMGFRIEVVQGHHAALLGGLE